jgi:cytochrome c oxidase subunit 2
MSYWGSLNLQNAVNAIIECIIYFHDYIIIILIRILIFITYFIFYISINFYLDKNLLESHNLEFIWTVLPIVILFFIAYPSLIILYFIENIESTIDSLQIKVVAHQWYWEYEIKGVSVDSYLKNIPINFYTLERTDSLIIPLNKLVTLYITSGDVLHSFTIPSFGVKVDAIPGRLNTLNFNSNIPGIFFGQCSEICGSNHRFMPIQVIIF